MTRRQRAHDSTRRFGESDNLPLQGLTGIGIVAVASMLVAGAAFALALLVSWAF